jgi:hypothetical protein
MRNLKRPGQKRRFLAFGLVNVTCSNAGLGYSLYGTQVFRVSRLDQCSASAYALLTMLLWFANWVGISSLVLLGCPRPTAAISLIPILATISYITQKYLIFPVRN